MDTNIEGLISVIIPTYNAAKYIEETLQSVINQTYNNIEIIVVDDGSTDQTEAILQSYKDPRLVYIKQANSGGPAKPRNTGIAASKGEYIAIFDSDDLMTPNKLSIELEALKRTPNSAFCCSNYSMIDDKGCLITADLWETNKAYQKLNKTRKDSFGNILFRPGEIVNSILLHNFIASSSMLIRKNVFQSLGGFDETLQNTDDYDMWLRMSPLYSCICVPQALHHYRVREGNITSRGIHKLADGRTTVLKRHINKSSEKSTTLHVKKIIAKYQTGAGYYYFQRQDLKIAKRYYWDSIRTLPTFNAFKYLISCILGERFIKTTRALKNSLLKKC